MRKKKRRKIKMYSSILCISDPHAPYEHPDTFAFLSAVKRKYKPDRIVCLGDEVDAHNMSFHDSDPDLLSAGDELQAAIEHLRPYYKLFPEMDILDSNHGSMVFRKAKHHGIPVKYIKSYNEVLDAPAGWKWHNKLIVRASNGQQIFFAHGLKSNGLALAQMTGMPCVQGHYHTEFNIKYYSSPLLLNWSMQVGCSIDDKSRAFDYNKVTGQRPIIGHGIIIDGLPKLLPMILNKGGRWNGYVP